MSVVYDAVDLDFVAICHMLIAMSVSMRLSDEIVERAKESAALFHRSPPQQIEHWAELGRVLEGALSFDMQKKAKIKATQESVDAALAMVGTPEGVAMAQEVIKQNLAKRRV